MLNTNSLPGLVRHAMRLIIPGIALCLFASIAAAQTFYQVQHTSGTSTYGNTDVTVIPDSSNTSTSTNLCIGGVQYILKIQAIHTKTYTFNFSRPTKHVRIRMVSPADTTAKYSFDINGQHFILSQGNLSSLVTGCTNCVNMMVYGNGYLTDTSFHGNAIGCIQADIIAPNISSFNIRIDSSVYQGVSALTGVYFLEDTTTFIQQPFTDTVKCPGDSLALVYSTNFRFNNNNTFTAQLSNSNGSFANPVNIGSRADTAGDTIWCKIPESIPAGNGYRIRIVSSSPADTSLDNQVNIRIKSAPGNLSNGSNSPVCTGDSLQLTGGSSSTGITWAWTGPNGFSSSAEDSFKANAQLADSGKYILKATLNSTGCSLSDTTTVEMRLTPDKPNATSNSPVCETLSLTLSTSSTTSGVSYSWSGPGSYSSGTQNPTVTASASSSHAGDYISTVTLNGCSSRDTTTVVVLPKPAKPTAAAPNSPLCARQDLQLTASTISGASYNWYGPSAFTANTQNPLRANVQMGDAGAYYVYATVSGCISDTDSVAVVVNTDPFVNIYPTPGATICPGQQVIFTAIPTNGGSSPVYDWRLNGNSTGSTGVTYNTGTLNNGDVVYCLMTSTGTCATPFTDTSNVITMTVLPVKAPKVSITADAGPSLFPNEPINFTATYSDAGANPTFQWKRSAKNVQGATGATWGANGNFLSNGDEICVLINSDYECPLPDTVLSNCIKLEIRVGVDDIINSKNIKIYPNPTTGSFNIEMPQKGNYTIQVMNMLGSTVYEGNMTDEQKKSIQLDNNLPPGNYTIHISGDGLRHVERLTLVK